MRLHQNLVWAVGECLRLIFDEGQQADKVLETALRSDPRWGARDRAFVAEGVYDMVRWHRLILHLCEEVSMPLDHLSTVGAWLALKGYDLPEWEIFEQVNVPALEKIDIDALPRAIRESVPDWMDAWAVEELGEQRWEKELTALNKMADVVMRANTLKCSREQLAVELYREGVEVSMMSELPQALLLEKRQNLFRTQAFQDGLFEVQDASSQMVAPMLNLAPGMRVVDACAGGGGKTLHIAALMKNQGQIIALDTYEWKLAELKKRAKRAGASNIETRVIESSKTIKRLHGNADRLLLDVPCSGMGVLRRNPDSKWKLSQRQLQDIRMTQAEILEKYAPICKPGGQIVYATCSIMPSENEEQVEAFLKKHEGKYRLLAQKNLSPAQHGFDGFFMASIERVGE